MMKRLFALLMMSGLAFAARSQTNEAVQTGARAVANRKGAFAGLPARERAVIEQAQGEKYPEEYGAQVEQYLLNLARESAAKK